MIASRLASPTLSRRISVIASRHFCELLPPPSSPVPPRPRKCRKQRHEHYEALGDAFKAVRDNSRGTPDFAALDKAIVVIQKSTVDQAQWFPKGTGPEAGKTRALPEIWSKPEEFAAAQKMFADKAGPLAAAVKAK